jgi:hypothetical protein
MALASELAQEHPLLWFNRSGHRDKRVKMGRGGIDSCQPNVRCIQPSSNEKRCP